MSSASTGGTEGSSPASSPASAASLTMAAPKYGTLVPNRIFVGGISASTSEAELAQVFSAYGNVKATKIISDRAGVSKGYGFVTFETEEEAKRLQQEADCIVLRERKLNIAPAIKKQPFSRSFDGSTGSPPSVPTSTYYYAATNGMSLPYQNGMTFYNTAAAAPATSIAPTDPGTIYQATGVFPPQAATGHQTFAPVMYPCPTPSLYMPPQYQFSPMPYESYYAGAAAGAPQYLYATGSSPSNTNGGGGGNSSGSSGTNGTGATSPPTAGPPPPLPPPHPTHFYAPAAPAAHHHPPVPTGPPPPAQVDHLYYPFPTGPHPAPPPHAAPMTEQLLLYATDATSCQQTSASDGQAAPQEDSRPTPSHSEQSHNEVQQAASGTSPATPLLPTLMPVKFPVSGRYHTNYHSIAITHAPVPPHSAQNADSSEDCVASPMHCRIIYPTVYIPHTHPPPPPYTHHNASGTASLLPTPFSASPHQSGYDNNSNAKTYGHNSRDCNKYAGGHGGNSLRGGQGGQNHGYPLAHHHNTYAKNTQNTHGGSQSYNNSKCSGNAMQDGSHKYNTPTIAVSSRLPVQYNRRTAGSNVGSSAVLRSSGGGYASNQAAHKVNHTTAYATNGRARHCGDDQYYEINNKPMGGGYGSGRKNYLSSNNNNNNNNHHHHHHRGGAARLDVHGNDNNRPNSDTAQVDSAAVVVTSTSSTTLSSRLSSPCERINADASNAQEKPASPPPAPYSPMTRPLPTLSPPTSQVQFYAPAQNRYQPSSMPLSQATQQQQQSASNQRSRYSVGQALSSANRKPSDKYSSTTSGSQTTMLRQSKYKVNGIMQATAATTVAGKLADADSLGGAGDGPGRLPITPPGTPRTAGHPAAGDQNQLSDTCHQMQALTL
ncbi:atrophin-1 [Monomorium pharaonis]|uniref:atrophin-1 n=1 Tax=Monomorium pharaonis TaxID=307658 RepID=UPI00063F6C97|nr:atrophin-1 [Monomorium pharaonis]